MALAVRCAILFSIKPFLSHWVIFIGSNGKESQLVNSETISFDSNCKVCHSIYSGAISFSMEPLLDIIVRCVILFTLEPFLFSMEPCLLALILRWAVFFFLLSYFYFIIAFFLFANFCPNWRRNCYRGESISYFSLHDFTLIPGFF